MSVRGKAKECAGLCDFYWRGMGIYQTGNAEVCRLSHGEESFWYENYKNIGEWRGDIGKENKEIK